MTGSGVSEGDHLAAKEPLLHAIYRFHMCYMVQLLLAELKVALPRNPSFDTLDSPYDRRAYQRLTDELEVNR